MAHRGRSAFWRVRCDRLSGCSVRVATPSGDGGLDRTQRRSITTSTRISPAAAKPPSAPFASATHHEGWLEATDPHSGHRCAPRSGYAHCRHAPIERCRHLRAAVQRWNGPNSSSQMAKAIAAELSVSADHRIRSSESGGTVVVHLGSSQGHQSCTRSSTGSGHPNSSNTIWCVVVSGLGLDHATDSRYANPRSADHCVTTGQGRGVAAGHPLAAASAPKKFATGVVGLPFRLVARMATRRFAVAHAKNSTGGTSRSTRRDRRMIDSLRPAERRAASQRS